MRVGIGYDCHAFCAGDFVMLGGIKIPYNKGVRAHSDGDVLLHALADALLGAAGLGDLGAHFPDNDPQYQNYSSSQFIQTIIKWLQQRHFKVVNVDATVITEAPKLGNHKKPMQQQVEKLLQIEAGLVNIKATTNEKMGWIGRGEGLAAQVVVLLETEPTTT